MKLNKEYKEITKDILENENYLTLKDDIHHGSSRYDHCKRVSYLSYLVSKLLKGNAYDAAISGLLHDFFHGNASTCEEVSYVKHPLVSVNNAKKYFHINEKEESIIKTHMYHYALLKDKFPFINKREKVNSKEYKPQSKDGYIVCACDLAVSIYETLIFKARYKTCIYILFAINLIIK